MPWRLRKPSATPPEPVFGIAWTSSGLLLGYAGYRLMIAKPTPTRNTALAAWSSTLLGIAGFSRAFLERKQLGEALGVSSAMVVTSAATLGTAALVDRNAARSIAPLLAWVLFATVPQEEVWRRNSYHHS